jgi:hypothetical protein
MTSPIKHTKWLNRVAANVVITENVAKFYIGIVQIDEGVVTPMDSPSRGAILRKNGCYVRDAWEWMDQIERNLQIVY